MKITRKTKFQLELDEHQLSMIKHALSDSAANWAIWSSKNEDQSLKEGGWMNYREVANLRDLFNEHYQNILENQEQ